MAWSSCVNRHQLIWRRWLFSHGGVVTPIHTKSKHLSDLLVALMVAALEVDGFVPPVRSPSRGCLSLAHKLCARLVTFFSEINFQKFKLCPENNFSQISINSQNTSYDAKYTSKLL